MAVHGHAVGTELDHRQTADPHPVVLERADATHHPLVRPVTVAVDPLGVVHLGGAIDRHPDLDAVGEEESGPFVVDQRGVGLDVEADLGRVGETVSDGGAPPGEPGPTGQQRLAAVEGDLHLALPDLVAPPADPLDAGVDDLVGHEDGPALPGLVALVVHVAIGAVEVAPRRDLEDERERLALQGGGIDRFGARWCRRDRKWMGSDGDMARHLVGSFEEATTVIGHRVDGAVEHGSGVVAFGRDIGADVLEDVIAEQPGRDRGLERSGDVGERVIGEQDPDQRSGLGSQRGRVGAGVVGIDQRIVGLRGSEVEMSGLVHDQLDGRGRAARQVGLDETP